MKIFSYKNCSALIRNDCINNFRLRSFVSRAPYPPEISKHHHPPPLTETQKKLSAAVQSLEVKVVDLEVYVDPNDHILVVFIVIFINLNLYTICVLRKRRIIYLRSGRGCIIKLIGLKLVWC